MIHNARLTDDTRVKSRSSANPDALKSNLSRDAI